jgi:hypothetical protein
MNPELQQGFAFSKDSQTENNPTNTSGSNSKSVIIIAIFTAVFLILSTGTVFGVSRYVKISNIKKYVPQTQTSFKAFVNSESQIIGDLKSTDEQIEPKSFIDSNPQETLDKLKITINTYRKQQENYVKIADSNFSVLQGNLSHLNEEEVKTYTSSIKDYMNLAEQAIYLEIDSNTYFQYVQECSLPLLSNYTSPPDASSQNLPDYALSELKEMNTCINSMNKLSFYSKEYQQIKSTQLQLLKSEETLINAVLNATPGNETLQSKNQLQDDTAKLLKYSQDTDIETRQIEQKIGFLDAQLPSLENKVNSEYQLLQQRYHFTSVSM